MHIPVCRIQASPCYICLDNQVPQTRKRRTSRSSHTSKENEFRSKLKPSSYIGLQSLSIFSASQLRFQWNGPVSIQSQNQMSKKIFCTRVGLITPKNVQLHYNCFRNLPITITMTFTQNLAQLNYIYFSINFQLLFGFYLLII